MRGASGLGVDVAAAHDVVADAARRGVPAVFTPLGDTGDTGGAEGAEGAEGAGAGGARRVGGVHGEGDGGDGPSIELPDYDDDEAWAGRTIDGAWLAALLTGGGVSSRGLALHGARIVGGLDLGDADLPFRLALADCQLGGHPIVLHDARVRTVDVARVRCGGLDAERATVGGALFLVRSVVQGRVRLVDARVDASVLCGGTRIDAPGTVALHAVHASIGGSLVLRNAHVTGEVRLSSATIGGNLNATGARIDNPGAAVPRDTGAVEAAGTEATGAAPLDGSAGRVDPERLFRRFELDAHAAVCAIGADVDGSIALAHGFAATGEVQLFGVRVGGDVLCAEATFHNPGGDALSLDGARIGGSVLFQGSVAAGQVRLVNSEVGGDLRCSGARLERPAEAALHASRATITGNVFLDAGFVAEGQVRLAGATIGGTLRCTSATMSASTGGGPPDGVALHAEAARIGAEVRLDRGFSATGQVRFSGADIGGGFNCREAHLDAGPGTGPALTVRGARVATAMLLMELDARGTVRFTEATIGGDVNCRGARLGSPATIVLHDSGPSRVALHGSGADVGGTVFLTEGFAADGEVRLLGISVGRDIVATQATVTSPSGTAVGLTRARVTGDVVLGAGFAADGTVRLARATVGGNLDLTGGSFTGGSFAGELAGGVPGGPAGSDPAKASSGALAGDPAGEGAGDPAGALAGDPAGEGAGDPAGALAGDLAGEVADDPPEEEAPAIDASHVQVSGGVLLSRATTVEGQLDLTGAAIVGDLDLSRARLASRGSGHAIEATNARVTGGVVLRGRVTGRVQLKGISIGGDLDCGGAQLQGTGRGLAMTADRAQITGSLLLNRGYEPEGFHARGTVRLRSASVGGHASCRGARFVNPGGTAVTFAGSRFAGDVMLTEGFRAEGSVRLGGAAVGGDLICTGAALSHPDGTALRLVGAHIRGTLWLDRGVDARGRVRLSGATIDGDVLCTRSRFVGPPGEPALALLGARIAGALLLSDGFHAEGPVVLRGATVGTLEDDAGSWPGSIDLDGFRYDRLVCPPGDRGWRSRRHWLRRQVTPSAQGYVTLAAVYRAAGDELDARRILIERHNALLRPPEHWRPQLPSGPMELARQLWRWVLRLTIGHGFAPGRALLIALPLLATLALWLGHARDRDMLVPTDETATTTASGAGAGLPRASRCDDRYPCMQPVVYALDNLVPLIELGQRSRWTPDQSHRGGAWYDDGRWLAAATWATNALGWVLATLVAASFTEIVRRD